MGYGVSQVVWVFDQNPRLPIWWIKNSMGYYELWVLTGMGYRGVDCNTMHCFDAGINKKRNGGCEGAPVLPHFGA
jgi:hypothetical protein